MAPLDRLAREALEAAARGGRSAARRRPARAGARPARRASPSARRARSRRRARETRAARCARAAADRPRAAAARESDARCAAPRATRPCVRARRAVARTRRSATRRSWRPRDLRASGRLARRLEDCGPDLPERGAFASRGAIIGRRDEGESLHAFFTPSSRSPAARARRLAASMRTLAAIDIGTNSIKLLVANVEDDGTLDVVLREKAMVRLGSETLRTGRALARGDRGRRVDGRAPRQARRRLRRRGRARRGDLRRARGVELRRLRGGRPQAHRASGST